MNNAYIRAAESRAELVQDAAIKLEARYAEAVDAQVIERARDPETGQFIGDDPATPDVNEAWVEVP